MQGARGRTLSVCSIETNPKVIYKTLKISSPLSLLGRWMADADTYIEIEADSADRVEHESSLDQNGRVGYQSEETRPEKDFERNSHDGCACIQEPVRYDWCQSKEEEVVEQVGTVLVDFALQPGQFLGHASLDNP